MSTWEFDNIERSREANEGLAYDRYYESATAGEADEEGDFAVRYVMLDGVERIESTHTSLRAALDRADGYQREMRAAGYTRRNLHVGVIDQDDPERGELDWSVFDD